MGNKYIKKCSTFLIINKMQIKITLRFHLTLIRLAIIKQTTNAGENVREKEPLYTVGENVN
jgi:hypothetical protein